MATIAYALRTEQREASRPGTSESTGQPGSTMWLDAVAALVPAEVLALHAFVMSQATTTREADSVQVTPPNAQAPEEVEGVPDEATLTVITDQALLKWSFWGLVLLAALIYLGKKRGKLDAWDVLRIPIPSVAFVLWTMLTPESGFDAVFPGDLSENRRLVAAAFGAIAIGVLAKWLATKADQQNANDNGPPANGPEQPPPPPEPDVP